jgi:hypothetical protein
MRKPKVKSRIVMVKMGRNLNLVGHSLPQGTPQHLREE